jgi:MFS family permease
MSSQQKPTKDRIYYSMLEKVGTLGRYQFMLGIFIVLVGMEGSACLLINPYIFYQQSFACPSEIADCKDYVCSLPPELRAPYTPAWDGRTSLANEFGDLRCEGSEFVTLANSIIILGSVLGVFVTIFFTEYLGRKGTTNLGLLTSAIGLGLTLIHSQTANVIGVFFYSAGLANSFTIITTFIVEFFPEKNNAQYFNLLTLSFAVGTAINPIAFYFIYDWKMVVIFVFLLPTVITLIGFYFIVENTPIELIAADDYNETYKAFMRIAKWNGVTDHGLTL